MEEVKYAAFVMEIVFETLHPYIVRNFISKVLLFLELGNRVAPNRGRSLDEKLFVYAFIEKRLHKLILNAAKVKAIKYSRARFRFSKWRYFPIHSN